GATRVRTLAESLERALEHSPRLGIAQSGARQALAQVDQAESLLKPRVDVFGTISEQTTSDLPAGLGGKEPNLASYSLATHGDSVTSGAEIGRASRRETVYSS